VNQSHLHLLLNHVPTVGAVAALGVLVVAFIRRNEHLKHVGLEILFAIALVTLPAFVTGLGAYREIRGGPELSDIAMRAHQDAAIFGFAVTELAGFVAWISLWQTRRRGRAARGLVAAATVLTVLAIAIMGRVGNLGGEIRHPEIRASVEAAVAAPETAGDADGQQFMAAAITQYMANESPWAWPAAESIHFLGMSLSLGVLLAVNLRILGVMPQVPFAAVHRLLPWGLLGFGLNLITGMLFVVAQPGQYVESTPFFWKIVFLLIAGANFLYLTVFKRAWADDRPHFPLADKAMAIGSIVAWLGVLYAGRMLPFLGNAF
jgi:uncharacterized membrane protein